MDNEAKAPLAQVASESSSNIAITEEKKKDKGSDKKDKKNKKADGKEPEKPPPLQFGANESKGFSVRVHIVEARELRSRDSGGTSDPICFVTLNGQKQKTAVMKKTLSCVWDHCFFFDLTMNQAEFESNIIQIDVFDANTIRRNVLIGSASVDLKRVYYEPGHEMYKKWVALVDKTGETEGLQGFLQFSCAVVVQGEPLPPPRSEDDEDDNLDLDNLDLQSLVLSGPDISVEEYYIFAKIYHADNLPQTDKNGLADPFLEVKCSGRSHRTQVKKNTLTPVFNEQLDLPAASPSLSDRVEILCYDWDRVGENDLICSQYFSFNSLREKKWGPGYIYFYGAPGGDCSKKADPFNRGYQEGSSYRGRLLLELSAQPTRKPRINSRVIPTCEIKNEEYKLMVDVYEGSEMVGTSSSVSLEFSVAHQKLDSVKSKNAKKGSVQFYTQTDGKILLPNNTNFDDIHGVPDLLMEVYVKSWTGSKQRAGYLRLKLADVMGFDNQPKWYTIQQDDFSFKYSEGVIPGDILMCVNFGLWDDAPEIRAHLDMLKRERFQLRTHLYQARNLPAADSNGLSDPYALVRISGAQVKSAVIKETLNPTWYTTVVLEVDLPVPLQYAPDINLLIYDYDVASGDDLLGRMTFPVYDADSKMQPLPEWYPLHFDDPAVTEGEILVSFQLIPLAEAANTPIPNIRPAFKDCYFEINAVGLRNLVPHLLLPINNPSIEFDTGDAQSRNATRNKARVNKRDADILETVHLSVPLPLEQVFAPVINVRVFDDRPIFGKVLVGTASIPIAPYLPWNKGKVPFEKQGLPLRVNEIPGARGSVARPRLSQAKAPGAQVEEIKEETDNKDNNDNNDNKDNKEKKEKKDNKEKKEINKPANADDVAIEVKDEAGEGRSLPEVEEQDLAGEMTEDQVEDEPEEEEKKHPSTDAELELLLADELPFEQFNIYRGKTRGLSYFEKLFMSKDALKNGRTVAGTFKGRFRVIENEKLRYVEDPINLKDVYKPRNLIVRVYCLRGLSIVPHDDNGYSDPYLILDTGVQTTTKKEGCLVMKTQNPDFFHCYEMKAIIPGSQLKISMWDHDDLSGDDLIGETCIDLENRFFCPKWVKMDPKLIELRTLWTDVSRCPQGRLEMFVEVLTPEEAARIPPKNIAPPQPKPFELRLVVWQTRKCAPKDEKKSDIFVSAMMDGMPRSERQETDSHWNSKDGTGSFNWRMKFPLMLPYPNPRLKLQIWDKDLISADDIIAEAILNLSKYFKRAYKTDKGFEFTEKWIQCYHPDFGAAVQGEIQVTLELLPKEIADIRPNGYRRDDPNQYPFLKPPIRPESSFNPLNPLGWIKLGGGAFMKQARYFCIVLGILAIIMLAWRLS